MGRIHPIRFSDAKKKRKKAIQRTKEKGMQNHADERLEQVMKKNPDWRIERGRRL